MRKEGQNRSGFGFDVSSNKYSREYSLVPMTAKMVGACLRRLGLLRLLGMCILPSTAKVRLIARAGQPTRRKAQPELQPYLPSI
jgi:hypothetical protein